MGNHHIEHIRTQFTRTADACARLIRATQERGPGGVGEFSGAGADDLVLDVACGPGFLKMAFATRCRKGLRPVAAGQRSRRWRAG